MRNYIIEMAELSEKKDYIIDILQRNLDNITSDRYAWEYEKAYCGKPITWLAKDSITNLFVGAASVFPRNFLINGEPIKAGLLGDFAVDKAHRTFGPALKMQKEILSYFKESGFELLYGTPNKQAEAIFFKLGYKIAGKIKRFVKIFKTQYKEGEYLPPRNLTKIIQPAINFAINLTNSKIFYRSPKKYNIEHPSIFNSRFNHLFSNTLSDNVIICDRNISFLNWRYFNSPIHNYKVLTLVGELKEIKGYIVYYIEKNMCNIDDVVYLNDQEILKSLFYEFFIFMREIGIGSIGIYFLENRNFEKYLRKYAFFERKNENSKLIYFANSNGTQFLERISNPNNWYFLQNDTDN